MDILKLPLVGRLLRHRYGRVALQSLLTVIAVALMIDGFVGPQSAARNLATVTPWVHYRGIVVIALLLAGNLFCMGCPFTLPRSLAKRLSLHGRRFPRPLRSKWLAIFSLFVLFFLYEFLDLWASPWLTAWVILFYFAASFVLEAVFTESAFCKYVCPLGSFNFVYSTLSPSQIEVKSTDICASCVGKECVNGSYAGQPMIRVDDIPVANASGRLTGMHKRDSIRDTLAAFAPAFVPIGFGIWFAHYSFHLLVAPGLIVPVIQEFLGAVGDWQAWSLSLDENIIGSIQLVALVGGFLGSMRLAQKAALRLYRRRGLLGMLPWALVFLVMMLSAWQIFTMPMEMRGTLTLFG